MTTLPEMGIVLPVEGGSSGIWDVLLDAIFRIINAHDHTAGKGVLVPAAGIGIDDDLSFASHAATDVTALALSEIAPADAAAYSDAIFVSDADQDLYFRNAAGTNVKITDGNTLNISIVGGIGGDYASVGALLSYDDSTRDYWLQQEGSPRPWAGLRTADIKLYEKAASIANYVAIKSPASLAAAYTVTFPAALPADQGLLQIDETGALVASNTLESGVSITLQGAANIKLPTRVFPFHITQLEVLNTTGTVSHSAGVGGCQQSSSSTTYYKLPDWMQQYQQVQSVTVFADDSGGTSGFSLMTYDESSTTFAAVTGASNRPISGGAATMTPTTPTTVVGTLYVLKVVSGSNNLTIKKGELQVSLP